MTFPFSHHNYQLRYWMAAGGIDPDEDVRLVVLLHLHRMVESLTSGHVDGFCVGAPWNSVAVDAGIGRILHFGCEIKSRVTEKVFAVREKWANEHPDTFSFADPCSGRGCRFRRTTGKSCSGIGRNRSPILRSTPKWLAGHSQEI